MSTNKEVYSTVDFDYWAYKEGLLPPEKALINKYLDKEGKTLEAGTAGGRILLQMEKLGFTSLYGFDYVPGLIEQAKERDTNHSISFTVEDASSLNYDDCCFDQIIYLQQIICLIEDEAARLKAIKEAYRVLKIGGIALFSFLNFDARIRSAMYLPYLAYLRLLRKLRRSNCSIQYLPWLKLGGKFNFSSLIDKEPYVYWYEIEEIYRILKEMKFEVIAIASDYQISQGRMHTSPEKLVKEPLKGMLYVVCKKNEFFVQDLMLK